jgi:16S rRNA (adenine1518-N6/adenine1519-N6)-dimethyltransferase
MARRRLGQHFLTDPAWQARLLACLNPQPGQLWVEIGAGRGELTVGLARRGVEVVAIELDPVLVEQLRSAVHSWSVRVIHGDILALPLEEYFPRRGRIFGSLPYYITSPILHRLFTLGDRVEEICVVVQWEVARRLVAQPGRRDYGYLSVVTQFFTRPEIVLRIPPGAFRPPPAVSSALVRMQLPGARIHLGQIDPAQFLTFLKQAFRQKRKTLLNNLGAFYGRDVVQQILERRRLPAGVRAEQLSLERLAEIFANLTGSSAGANGMPAAQPARCQLRQRRR